MEAEGSGGGAPSLTLEEQYTQLEAQMVRMRDENMRLHEEAKKRGKQPD